MSFQLIEGKEEIKCKDFKSEGFKNRYCAFSNKCKKEGYMRAPKNIDLCTGIKEAPRPKKPTPDPPLKREDLDMRSGLTLQDGDMI